MPLSETLKQTIRYAGLATDNRGLLPIAVARKILKGTAKYPGAHVHEGEDANEKKAIAESHKIHAALVSLATPEEVLGQLARITWGLPLYDATTLVERYGAAVLPWFAGVVKNGVLEAKTYEIEPALAMTGSEAAFELLLKVRTIHFIDEPRKHGLGEVAEVPELDAKARIDVRVEGAIDQFITLHPLVAARVIARRIAAAPKDKRLEALVKRLSASRPGKAAVDKVLGSLPVEALTTNAILELLDQAAKDPSPQAWPKFATGIEDDPMTLEYHALRIIAARSKKGEDWGVVLERITGSFSPWEPARIERFLFGSNVRDPDNPGAVGLSHTEDTIDFKLDRVPDQANGESLDTNLDGVVVRGPAGTAKLSNALVKKHDLKPGLGSEYEGDPGFNLRLRAYLTLHPDAFWDATKDVVKELQIADPEVLVDTDAFCHVVGATYKRLKSSSSWHGPPSKSKTYQSLAEALVKRNKKLFVPGKSNVDVRLHAINKTKC